MTSAPLLSPLHARHQDLQAKFADFGGWQMPLEFPNGGVLKEHAAVRDAVGIFDVSHLGKLRVRGPGAADFVNGVFTNDLARIEPGRAQYSLLCNESGGVLDDLIVYLRSADEVFVIPNAANSAVVVDTLSAVVPSGVTVENLHDQFAVIAVQGPRARDVVSSVGLPTELEYMAFTDADWNNTPVVVCRTGYTGEPGFELLPRWDDALQLWDALLPAATEAGGLPAGLAARDTLRTEMGYPLHGQDLSPEISPVQARLGWAVGWDKPAFAGRGALAAERAAGPRRRLWGLSATDRGIPRPQMPVTDAIGMRVGEVTSGTFSPSLRHGIGLALLDQQVEVGDLVQVDVRGRPSVMKVCKPPFVQTSTR
jgi:glycine cleavage system T protein (aminomethyltransferase)